MVFNLFTLINNGYGLFYVIHLIVLLGAVLIPEWGVLKKSCFLFPIYTYCENYPILSFYISETAIVNYITSLSNLP